MKELEFLKIIKEALSNSTFIGDDCACLKEFDICITQDTLVEDIHFSLKTIAPYYLGRKAVAVNLSDLAAGLATPKYITVSLSTPNSIDSEFIKELYRGINDICKEYNTFVVGGDITKSDKIFISIAAIGKKESEFTSSRSRAKSNQLIVTTGIYGSSACGLYALINNYEINQDIINAHINPKPKISEAIALRTAIEENIAAMDTSDGLVDAVYKIAQNSKHNIEIDFDKIPIDNRIIELAKKYDKNYKNWVLWGGEDYELIACVDIETYEKLPPNIFKIIGKVQEHSDNPVVTLNIDNQKQIIDKNIFEDNAYNHFEDKK